MSRRRVWSPSAANRDADPGTASVADAAPFDRAEFDRVLLDWVR